MAMKKAYKKTTYKKTKSSPRMASKGKTVMAGKTTQKRTRKRAGY